MRIAAVCLGSALMAVGGAFLTMSAFDAFYFGMVNGRGWICIALVVFASWNPLKALFGALRLGTLIKFVPHPVMAGFQNMAAARKSTGTKLR